MPPFTEALIDELIAPRGRQRAQIADEIHRALIAEPVTTCDWLKDVLQHGDTEARSLACALLGAAPADIALEPLLRALSDPSPSVQRAAARALAQRRAAEPAVVLALLGAAASDSPPVRATALAVLAVLAPSPPVARALGSVLVTDRFSAADAALCVLEGAPPATALAVAPLLEARDPLERRAGLALLHATGAPVDPLVVTVSRLARPGNDAYVRRAAVRALGHVVEPGREWIALLAEASRDWDPTLRAIATVALGQLARTAPHAHAPFAEAVASVADEDIDELAAALRSSGEPAPPHGPLLARLARARGFAQADLADALIASRRARPTPWGALRGGALLPVDSLRIDYAIERAAPARRPFLARAFLALVHDQDPVVRACCAVFATQLHPDVETAIVLQRAADADADGGVRAVATGLIEQIRG